MNDENWIADVPDVLYNVHCTCFMQLSNSLLLKYKKIPSMTNGKYPNFMKRLL